MPDAALAVMGQYATPVSRGILSNHLSTEETSLNTNQDPLVIELKLALQSVINVMGQKFTSDDVIPLILGWLTEATSKLKETLLPKTETSLKQCLSATPKSSSDSSFKETTYTAQRAPIILTGVSREAANTLLALLLKHGAEATYLCWPQELSIWSGSRYAEK